jgi:hypothetical protein
MLLDDEALGKQDTGFMSIDDLMNASNETSQRPPSFSKSSRKTPTNTVFTNDESEQGKENKDNCSKGVGEVPSFKKVNNQVPTGNRIRKK